MMDDMDKMEKKRGMGDGMMKGNMPSDGPMPSTDSSGSMQDPMAAPSSSDMMGRMRGSMPARRGMGNMAPSATLPGFPGAPTCITLARPVSFSIIHSTLPSRQSSRPL